MCAVAEGHERQQRPAIIYRRIRALRDAIPRLDFGASCVVEADDGDQRDEAACRAPGGCGARGGREGAGAEGCDEGVHGGDEGVHGGDGGGGAGLGAAS